MDASLTISWYSFETSPMPSPAKKSAIEFIDSIPNDKLVDIPQTQSKHTIDNDRNWRLDFEGVCTSIL